MRSVRVLCVEEGEEVEEVEEIEEVDEVDELGLAEVMVVEVGEEAEFETDESEYFSFLLKLPFWGFASTEI